MLPTSDHQLLQIVDSALADATRRAQRPDGSYWLACHPGCTPCCHGLFRISSLDAQRLRTGLQFLATTDPARAAAIQTRAQQLVTALSPHYPGNPQTGELPPNPDDNPDPAWDHFADLPEADAAPCPVLDPATGRCQLYAHRPLTCRIFGPPVQNADGIGLCELCYIGATEADILHGEMHLTHHALEAQLTQALDAPTETTIPWALLQVPR